MPSVRFARDTAAGLFLAAIGLVFFLASDALPMGTASRMATGYFPKLLSTLLMLLGLAIAVKGSFTPKKPHEPIYRFDLKRLIVLTALLLFFAFALEPLGLIPAMTVLTAGASALLLKRTLLETLLLTAAIDLLITVVFVASIGLELPLWPSL